MSDDADRESFVDAIRGAKAVKAGNEYPPFFNFEEEGDWIKGIISNPREIDTIHGTMKIVDITTQDGTFTLGLSMMLQGLYKMAGKSVVVKYCGKVKNKDRKGSTKQFEVYEV